MDGISVLEAWRRTTRHAGVMLTARDRWSDKVQDLMPAPMTMWRNLPSEEVLARVRALLRRRLATPK
jgi:DNA-binding response OmpR family regulator